MDAKAPGNTPVLQFMPFSSAVDVGFWHTLTKNKLEIYKLDDSAQPIDGYFVNNDPAGLPCRLNVDYAAFDSNVRPAHGVPRTFMCRGEIINKNTIEDFKGSDKKKLLQDVVDKVLNDIASGKAATDPSLLFRFLILTYADLKKYHFYYWFAFPAVVPNVPFGAQSMSYITQVYNPDQISALQIQYDNLRAQLGWDPAVFLLKIAPSGHLKVDLLSNWENFIESSEVTVGFSDPSTLPENPGWPLRNILALVAYKWGRSLTNLKVVCYRDRVRQGVREISHSLVIGFGKLPEIQFDASTQATGWELNQRGKMGPRMVNLSATMDPVRLAESAVDLNLKLMRWRLMPDLNLEKVAAARCLLLGSGTLGCNVARGLLGWGVRTITFVDNSKVSYSNPVRQTLFSFDDCLNGGKPKAQAAADSMRRIFPGVNATAHELTIPMPGHAIGSAASEDSRIQADVRKLEQLIDDHDAVFLLMDTRESRWLPSVIASSKGKVVLNAALGFDTFMIMRHGTKKQTAGPLDLHTISTPTVLTQQTVRIAGDDLGCYFCNDVVAPGNSTEDRTLDQQCTVSRPGVSMIASALAVELLVSILQHPLGARAPAETSANDNHLQAELEVPIGIIPHQIRCFLSRYNFVLPATLAFDKCTGCSPKVISAYESEGFDFLRRVFNVPRYLEDLTGLTELHASIDNDAVEGLSDDENDGEVEEGDRTIDA